MGPAVPGKGRITTRDAYFMELTLNIVSFVKYVVLKCSLLTKEYHWAALPGTQYPANVCFHILLL